MGRFDNRQRFENFTRRFAIRNVYRAKGIVKFSGEGWSIGFNYTCGRFRLDWLAPAEEKGFDISRRYYWHEAVGVQEAI